MRAMQNILKKKNKFKTIFNRRIKFKKIHDYAINNVIRAYLCCVNTSFDRSRRSRLQLNN